jgi:N-acetylglutamate synthase-like GNAT family acetyltransferase
MSCISFQLRPAEAADIAQIDALLARSYPRLLAADYEAATLAVALPMMAVTRPALFADRGYYVAEKDNQIVGAGGWTRQVPGQDCVVPGRGNIRRLIVDDRQLRIGIAAALMIRAHTDALAAGMHEMFVLSTRTALPFYTAVGYKAIRDVDVPLGDADVPFPSVEMSHTLIT